MVGTVVGISEAVSGFQASNRSISLAIASRWLWCYVAGSYLMVHERNLRVWTMRSLSVSMG